MVQAEVSILDLDYILVSGSSSLSINLLYIPEIILKWVDVSCTCS